MNSVRMLGCSCAFFVKEIIVRREIINEETTRLR